MKIIQALKSIKDLYKKFEDLKDKAKVYCADLDCETPTYPDQRGQISTWVQSAADVLKEILRLKYCIQKTNVSTLVTIELGNKHVTKTITEWIYRRKDLAQLEEYLWKSLTDKGLKEIQTYQVSQNTQPVLVKKRLYFDPVERDTKVELYRSEKSKIDAALEIVNATTDLIE